MWKLQYQYPLRGHNTFGMEVQAACFVEYQTVEELRHFLRSDTFRPYARRFWAIGAGSNLLFDGDYPGLILHGRIADLQVVQEDASSVLLRVGAGYVWDELVDYCVRQGYYGVENLTAIPGEVGASAVQNIGAYGVEVEEAIEQVEALSVLEAEPRTFTRAQCRYGYRDSLFKNELKGQYILTHVTYRLSKVPAFRLDYGALRAEVERLGGPSLAVVRKAVQQMRAAKLPDPRVEGNAGSFFKNPVIPRAQYLQLQRCYPTIPCYPVGEEQVKVPAGWLIEQCGWKGRSLGRAAVHGKQALVLVNKGGATGAEVWTLAQQIRGDIRQRFGITICPEVNYIGKTETEK